MDQSPSQSLGPVDNGEPARRIFFALWPDGRAAGEIVEWAQAAHSLCGGRMMRPETLHMTLAFLGNTPAVRAHELVRLARQWPVSLGTLALRRFGRFERPRIVWAGPSSGDADRVEWLDALYSSLWARLESLGWRRPQSIFRPHVSLLRNAGPGDLNALRRPPIIWTPQQCVLVASRPCAAASRYELLARLPLRE